MKTIINRLSQYLILLLASLLLVGSGHAQVHQSVLDYRKVVKSTDVETYRSAAKAVRLHMIKADPYRPLYHFTGVESWANDVNGPIFYEGRYHMFYQYDPMVPDGKGGWRRSSRCWGHAVSDDLVHWEDWPVALWPDVEYDRNGVYSGNTFIHEGKIHGLYTGNVDGHEESYGMLMWSDDGGVTFKKKMVMHDRQRPNQYSPVHWDAQVWKEGDTWCQLIGGATEERQGAAWLWKSDDLVNWTLQKNIAPSITLGRYWELPYLVPLGDRHVFMVGVAGNPYWIGRYDPQTMLFTPQTPKREVDTGHYYAVNPHMTDHKGPDGSKRRIMFAWAQIGRPPQVEGVPYWEQAHSLPRVITIKDDRLWQEPIPELQSLRCDAQKMDRRPIPAGKPVHLPAVRGDAMEIIATFDQGTAQRIGLIVRADANGDGEMVWVDAGGKFGIGDRGNAHFLKAGEPAALRVFVDRGVLEVYCNGAAVTHECFAPADKLEVFLFSKGGDAALKSLEAWRMRSMWEKLDDPAAPAEVGRESEVSITGTQGKSAAQEENLPQDVTFESSGPIGLGPDEGVMRRDPSDIIKVNDAYYAWYTRGNQWHGYDDATIWYATSPDGRKWTEQGEALSRGAKGAWDERSVFTPGILVAEGKYWLFYTAVPNPFIMKGNKVTKTAIGIAVADSPDGPFKRIDVNPVLIASDNPECFDSMRVDDSCLIVRDGQYWLYYKGRQWNNTPANTKMGLAVADRPQGPYRRISEKPIIPGGHEVVVWPRGKGVVAMVNHYGSKSVRNTLQFAEDGMHFAKLCDLPATPNAAGPYRPEAFTDSGKGEMIQWGLQIMPKHDGLPYLTRFDFNW